MRGRASSCCAVGRRAGAGSREHGGPLSASVTRALRATSSEARAAAARGRRARRAQRQAEVRAALDPAPETRVQRRRRARGRAPPRRGRPPGQGAPPRRRPAADRRRRARPRVSVAAAWMRRTRSGPWTSTRSPTPTVLASGAVDRVLTGTSRGIDRRRRAPPQDGAWHGGGRGHELPTGRPRRVRRGRVGRRRRQRGQRPAPSSAQQHRSDARAVPDRPSAADEPLRRRSASHGEQIASNRAYTSSSSAVAHDCGEGIVDARQQRRNGHVSSARRSSRSRQLARDRLAPCLDDEAGRSAPVRAPPGA